jgi:1-pyrroline-5-carboxylate dehydrogenase
VPATRTLAPYGTTPTCASSSFSTLVNDEVGRQVVASPDVEGLTFTGSYQTGMQIYHQFAGPYPKPVVCEMGGKNAAIVSAKADLATAAAGIARSAFGFSGQKCSACSRVYVERTVYDEFLATLAAQTRELTIDDPTKRDVFSGPVIDDMAVKRFRSAVEHATKFGRVITGGEIIKDRYLQPTVVSGLPLDDHLLTDELFVPFVAVQPVDSLAEAIELANATDLGLSAGFFSADDNEVEEFLNRIEAGVVYVNRAAGATTGAWPGVQPFGGWKGSGSSGKAGGGLYYVQQFMREQSRTVVSR